MRAGEVLDDGEAKTCAAHLARARAVNSVETLEDALDVLGRDAFASVRDCDAVAASFALMPDRDRAVFAIELDGVVGQVREHLLQTARVCEDDCIGRDFIL